MGWCYYGEKLIEYLFGVKSILPYRLVFIAFIGVGAMSKLSLVWNISDTLNGLMAIPNLIGLIFLTPAIVQETRKYFQKELGAFARKREQAHSLPPEWIPETKKPTRQPPRLPGGLFRF